MPVVFDEVVGTVVTDTTPSDASPPTATAEPDPLQWQLHLRRLERRAKRLKAD
jgi:hypothetical protein